MGKRSWLSKNKYRPSMLYRMGCKNHLAQLRGNEPEVWISAQSRMTREGHLCYKDSANKFSKFKCKPHWIVYMTCTGSRNMISFQYKYFNIIVVIYSVFLLVLRKAYPSIFARSFLYHFETKHTELSDIFLKTILSACVLHLHSFRLFQSTDAVW